MPVPTRLSHLHRMALGLLLAMPLVFLGTQSASAHAFLVNSFPETGTQVESPPTELALLFSEPVDTDASLTKLTTPEGAVVPTTLSSDGTRVVLRPAQTLPVGGYLLPWKVVSKEGHLIEGVVAFAVGTYPPPEGSASSSSDSGFNRWRQALAWLAIFVAASAAFSRRPLGWAFLGLFATLLSVVRLFDLGSRMGGWGQAWQLGEFKAAALIGVAGVLLAIGRRFRPAAIAGIAVFALQPFVVGHSLDTTPAWLFATLNVAHLAAATCWVGALVALLAIPEIAQARTTARVSKVAIIVLLIAAVVNASALLGVPGINWGQTSWTWLLGVKLLLVIAMLAIGWANNRRIARGDDPRSLRTAVAAELVLVVGIALVTSTMVTQRPPVLASPASELAPEPTPTATVNLDADGELVKFSGNWNVLIKHPPITAGVPNEWAVSFPIMGGVQNAYATVTKREAGAKPTYHGMTYTKSLTWNAVLTFPTPGEYEVLINAWRQDGRVSTGSVVVTAQ